MKIIRILFIDDNKLDVELLIRHLKKGDFEMTYDVTASLDEISLLISQNQYDICICDFKLQGFTGIDVIKLVKSNELDLPVILVSGAVPDQTAIDAVIFGAKDYVLKDNLSRLILAVEREVEALWQRKEKKKSDFLINSLLNTTIGVRISDEYGNIITVNNRYSEIIGYTKEEIEGQNISLVTPIENREEQETAYKALIDKGGSIHNEFKEVKKNGNYVDVLVTDSVEKADDQIFVVSTIQDISDLLMNKSFLEQTSKSAGVGGWEYHIENDVVKMSPKIFEIFEMDDKTDKNAEQLISIYHEDDRQTIRDELVDCITNHVPKSLPLRINGLKGTKKYVRLTFDPFVVNNVAIKLYGSLKDITEEKLLELEIEEREKRYRLLFDNNPNPLMIIDDSGSEKILDTNQAASELNGYKKEELVGMSSFNLIQRDSLKEYKKIIKSLDEKEKAGNSSFITKHVKKNGEFVIVDVHWKRINLGGKKSRLLLLIDITKHAMYEEELLKTNTLLKTLIDSAPIGVVTVSTKGIVDKVWNEQAENIFGWTKEEATGKFLPYAIKEKRIEALKYLQEVEKKGKTELVTIERQTKKGKQITLREYLTPLKDEEGKVDKVMLLIDDITDATKIERALVDSEGKYRNLVEASHDLVWRIDVEGNFNFINNASSSILGYSPSSMMGNSFFPYISPEKREEAIGIHRDIIEGNVYESFSLEMLTVEGEVKHLSATGYPMFDRKGNIVGCAGTATDITYLKNYQSQLEESLAEKEVLIKEIHHRVKNNLAVISGLFVLQSMHVDDEETLIILQESQSRIKSIATIHEKLYQNHVFSSIEMKEYLIDLVKDIADTYERKDKDISIEVMGDEVYLNVNQAVPFGILANELIVNAYKYAFVDKNKGKIKISITVKGVEAVFKVADNGQGLPVGFDIMKLTSLGMTLIRTLAEQLDSSFDWESKQGKGTTFSIKFVPDKIAKSTWVQKKPDKILPTRPIKLNKK